MTELVDGHRDEQDEQGDGGDNANAAPTRSHRVGDRTLSHREAVERIREAEYFVINVPVVRHIWIPRPDRIVPYVILAVLVAAKFFNWPLAAHIGITLSVAVALGIQHAISGRLEKKERASREKTAAEIDELRTELRSEIRRLADMLPRNGEGDKPPTKNLSDQDGMSPEEYEHLYAEYLEHAIQTTQP